MAGEGRTATLSLELRDQLSAGLRSLIGNVNGFARELGGSAVGAIESAGSSLSSFASGAVSTMTSGLVKGAAALGIVGAGFGAFAVDAAKAESAQKSFMLSMEKAGKDGPAELQRLRDASLGMVNDLELMKQTTKGSMLIGTQAMDKFGGSSEVMAKLLNIAQASARATGQDVSFLFDSVVTGVARASPMILDNLGLSIKQGDAFAAMGRELGKAADQLTPAEQKMAILNQVLSQGQGFIDKYGISSGGVRTKIQQWGASIDNLKVQIGGAFLPVLGRLLDFGMQLLPVVSRIVGGMKVLFTAFASLPQPVVVLVTGLAGLAAGVKVLLPLLSAIPGVGTLVTGVLGALSGPLVLLIPLAAALFSAWSTNFMGIRDRVSSALAPIMPILDALRAGVSAFTSMFTGQMQAGAGPLTALSAAFGSLAMRLQATPLGPLFTALATAVSSIGPVLSIAASTLASVLAPALQVLSGLLPVVTGFLTTLGAALTQIFSGNLVGGIQTLLAGWVNFEIGVAGVAARLLPIVFNLAVSLATQLGGFALQAIPFLLQGLAAFGTMLVGLITTYGPVLVQALLGWATALGAWVWNAIPGLVSALAGFASTLFNLIVTYAPVLASSVLGWASALVSFLFGAGGLLRTGWAWLMGTLGSLITTGLPIIVAQLVQWASAFVSWIPGAAARLLLGLGSILLSIGAFILSALPQIIGFLWSWISELGGFALKAIPFLIVSLAQFAVSLYAWVAGIPARLVTMVLGWGAAFLSWLPSLLPRLATGLGILAGQITAWIIERGTAIGATISGWAEAFTAWLQAVPGRVQAGIESLVARVQAFITGAGPRLKSATDSWIEGMAAWATSLPERIRAAFEAWIASIVSWVTGAYARLKSAALGLASNLVEGFKAGLTGGGGGVSTAAGRMVSGAEAATRSPWATFQAGQRANANRVVSDTEMEFMRGGAKSGAALAAATAEGIKANQGQVTDAAAGMAGAGAGAAMPADAGAGAGKGAAGAGAQDPVQTAMQSVQQTGQMIQSGLDAIEKMFSFRGLPPPEILDAVFDALKEIMKRAMSLAAGVSAESAQAAGAVAQMLSGFTSALTGMVDLAEKLARFRVPAQPNLDALLQLGETIVVIAKKLVAKMGEAGLAQSLEQSAISQKTAEMLKAWVDTLTGMAEATQALAKGRWTTIDMGGPERFFIEIARFAVWMQVWFRYAFPQENMRLLLMDSRDTAETLKPWIENLKGIAEATQALAKARWQIDMGKPEAFFVRLAYFVIGLQQRLARDIGYTILLALDDAKLVAEVIKPWIENLSAAAEATGKLARARFPSDLSGPERFFAMLAGAVVGIARSLQQQLTNDLLVVLEDAKLIAETLSSWLEPLKATQEVAASIGRADLGVDMSGLGAFYVGLWNQLTQLHSLIAVQTAGAILIVLEDSKLIAETLGAWMDPLTSTADVLGAIDTLRLYASKRGDQTLTALWEFLSGLAVMTGRFVATGQQVLSGELLSALDTSREIAETFGKWLDPLGKLGEVALSVDKVRLQAHTRWDTTMNAAGAMFVEIAMMSGALASGAARALGGQAMRAMEASRQIADTFLKWLEPLSKLGEVATSVDVVRRMAQTRWDSTLGAVKAMFAGIGFVTNEVVQAVQREADPEGQLKVSQVVGQTFGTWLDILAKLGQATDSIRRTHTVDAGVLRSMVMMLATIASTSNEIVQAVQRAASPEEQLGVSRAVAETFDAWVKTFGGLKTATQALAEVVDIPDNVLSGALNLLLAMTRLTAPIVQAVMRAADPGPVLEMSRAVADTFGSWIKVFADTADLTHKLVTTEPVNPSELGIVEGILSAAWAALLRISADFRALGDLVREDLLSGAKAFIEMAGGALDLFSKARDLDLREVIPLRPEDLAAVETTIQLVFSSLVGLVDRLMPKLTGAMQRLGERGKAFLDLAKPALDLFAAAAPLGEKLYGAVAPSEASYLMLSGVIARVVLAIEQLAVGWAEGKARLTESVAQMTGFSSAARAALDVVKPALEAFQALSNSEQGRITPAAVNRVRATVATMMQLIDELKTGYLNARGELDAARTGAISGFSDAAKSTLDAAGGAVDFLVKLFDSQGKLGALTSTAKAQIKAGIQAVVGLMMEMALQYDMATLESRKAIERSVAFADETSKMAGSLGGVVDALAKIYDFAFKENAETGKREAVIRQWGGNVRAGLQGGIEMVILTLSDILSSVGSYALSRAQFVADRIAPVASAIGSMTEPIQKLMENPLVDSKSRTAWSSRAAQTRIKQLADNMVKGIQTMVDVMVRGLKGVKVPSGIDAGVSRLISVVNGLVAAIDSAMQMPEIDFGVLADLVKASRVLAEISLPAGAAAGALALGLGSPGAPGPGALALPPSIGAPVLSPPPGTGGIGGAVPLPQTIELDGATVVLTNAVLSGDVTATGRVLVEDGQEVTVELDGEVISKSQKSGDFQRSRSRSAGDPG